MAHTGRSSISSQLPPTTIASTDEPTSLPATPVLPPPVLITSLPHASTSSATHPPLPLNASNIQLHNSQFSLPKSSTHVFGIQPSAPFKPMKAAEYSSITWPNAQRYPLPSSIGISGYDDLELEADDDVFKTNYKRGPVQPAIPHPLSSTFSTGTLSPSLSQHRHHHSNHSLEDLKEHEDRGVVPSDNEEPSRLAVNPKLSREPLIDSSPGLVPTIPGTPHRIPPINTNILIIGNDTGLQSPGPSRPSLLIGSHSHSMITPTTSGRFGLMRTVFGSGHSGGGTPNTNNSTPPHSAISATYRRDSKDFSKPSTRNSLDMSINTKAKRNSVYKPRLTFESLRRSSASKEDGSRRESYVGTTEDDFDHPRRPPFSAAGIPLTPTKSGAACRNTKGQHHRLHERSELSTPRKGRRGVTKRLSLTASASSRSPSSSVVSTDDEDGSLDGGVGTPISGMFNPTPPLWKKGEASKMRTPLWHPLDPSLIPIDKLEKELALKTRKRRRRVALDKVMGPPPFGSRKGAHKEKQPGLPTSTLSSVDSSTNNAQTLMARELDDKASLGESMEGRLARRYELHPSRNRFYFRGRIMMGGDSPWAFIMILCLFCGLTGLWFGTTGVWWWREAGLTQIVISLGNPPPVGLDGISFGRRPGSTAIVGVEGRDWTWVTVDANARRAGKAIVIVCAYLAGIVISSMLVTAFSDPGILPRGLDLNPPYPANSPSDGGVRVPMPRDIKVRSDVVRTKYCPTCKTYRPPRASHCKMCDNCVDGCDHHCQWVNNCVGSRNYTTFFVLLMSASLALILLVVTSALHLYYLTVWQSYNFRGALGRSPGSAVVFCLSILVIWPVGALLSYHLRLLLLNITTIEQIRNQAHRTLVQGPAPPNPFSHGSWRKNFIAVLCKPQMPSWLNASGVATEDRREVNPGLLGGPTGGVTPLREGNDKRAGRGLDSARSDVSALGGWSGSMKPVDRRGEMGGDND